MRVRVEVVVGAAVALLGAALLAPTRPGPVARAAAAPAGVVPLVDVTGRAGIHFSRYPGPPNAATLLEQSAPGVCVGDFDGDGWLDFYLLNGRDLSGHDHEHRNALYRNNHDGTFTDVTDRAGVPGTGYGVGCVWGDYDNSGRPSLYVSQYGTNILYRNNGDGTFTDVTDRAGVGALDYGARFHSAAAFIDYARDGRLDLYAGSYLQYDPSQPCWCGADPHAAGEPVCNPQSYAGTPSILFRNNGDGTFTNVTKAMGVYDPLGKTLAVQSGDYNGDGWPDLIVANDDAYSFAFTNLHGRGFRDDSLAAGISAEPDGAPMDGMAVDLGDVENNGHPDLFMSDFQDRGDHLFHNDGNGDFSDVSAASGLLEATRDRLGFGGGFIDLNNNGRLDLFVANGHICPSIGRAGVGVHYRQRNQVLYNDGRGHFVDQSDASGPAFQVRNAGRGVAFADFFNDGHMDVLVANVSGPPVLLRNLGVPGSHFLTVRLIGTKSNADALGAKLRLRAGALREYREIRSGGSFAGNYDPRPHFGLGPRREADLLEVDWPSGERQVFHSLRADHFYVIVEGDARLFEDPGDPHPLRGLRVYRRAERGR